MMYQDKYDRLLFPNSLIIKCFFFSLFLGICNENVDRNFVDNGQQVPQMIIRFEDFKKQDFRKHPMIIFSIYKGS